MKTFKVFWSPEGRCIATVQAADARAAIRKAPTPYRKFPGEMYAEEVQPESIAAQASRYTQGLPQLERSKARKE